MASTTRPRALASSSTLGETVSLVLRGTVAGKHVRIHKQATVFNGHFVRAIAFPRGRHRSGEHWTVTATYSGDSHLLAATVTKSFRLEAG